MTAPIDTLSTAGTTALNDANQFVFGSNVNVLYKAFSLVGILIVLAVIPQTSKFAGYAAWAILLVLMLQQQP